MEENNAQPDTFTAGRACPVVLCHVAWLYATRIPAITKNKIVLRSHRPAAEFHAQLPAEVRWKRTTTTFDEQPTLFYAVTADPWPCSATGAGLNTYLAWLYSVCGLPQPVQATITSVTRAPFSWLQSVVMLVMSVRDGVDRRLHEAVAIRRPT